MTLSSFLATKRVGSVLRSNEALTWLQATKVLAKLEGELGDKIDQALLELGKEIFAAEDVVLIGEKSTASDELPSHRDRGQIYHSRRIVLSYEGFRLVIGISFTVCVKISIPFLDHAPRTSQSKFWCSAIISTERPFGLTGDDDSAFAHVCEKIDGFSQVVRDHVCPHYSDAVRQVRETVEGINATGDMFSTIVFQVEDERFREHLTKLSQREERLSEMPSDSALGLLNRLFSSRHAMSYLHADRDHLRRLSDPEHEASLPPVHSAREAGNEVCLGDGVTLDTILHTDRLRARALVIETRKRDEHRFANWRLLGVTSASEPVLVNPERVDDPLYRMLHSPANVLSAEMAAEIGEQF
ncbi:hypothetical protein [Sphingomonas sp.]|uniref:hypothetical protein n=1 Tax=Sphingomonas sp. TaxID=28214 RepID=UPI003F704C88